MMAPRIPPNTASPTISERSSPSLDVPQHVGRRGSAAVPRGAARALTVRIWLAEHPGQERYCPKAEHESHRQCALHIPTGPTGADGHDARTLVRIITGSGAPAARRPPRRQRGQPETPGATRTPHQSHEKFSCGETGKKVIAACEFQTEGRLDDPTAVGG